MKHSAALGHGIVGYVLGHALAMGIGSDGEFRLGLVVGGLLATSAET
jgi:hypothetical protein